MISHVSIGIGAFGPAFAFYDALLGELGWCRRFAEEASCCAAWQPADGERPLIFITRPFDGGSPAPGNGLMTALMASDRRTVDRCHALALALGGRDEGEPGLRPHYHPDYYGAYFRDPDGNKLCVCCHAAEPG
ncbi:VOC family protein [Ancylobacter sp. 6x-1]|uniref:VOC family protein n=1 Tax=Ancylobacter crimeensis TaxID=2579147 RepID=A0ABT0D850_9HYPH|nr:VOC family protein [Ancylobacter crimeensis]MCK0196138.1 VOC family protein [Ancylobacter crimeensis]